ncbi:phosphotransferase [Actinomadura algeriensis]|uniref:Aminoglycoside phosphotransferase (APT) family kinase protein n=1 Tax=Actinomadura algeriensis TaxID=1679523 RepID=A0ABR9JQ36_9ACTN|nr:phosphotransferase [Actinomadura algeriensis]MBE1532685.1 aminoglycoside phosphotransferase (APT) family kinase protein [Actinomadura algeriensis]
MTRTTHHVEISDVVVKRYRARDHDQPHRERRALELLRGTGLAPEPLHAEPDADPPSITMSRLPGTPLDGYTPATAEAVARTLARLHAVPSGGLPDRAGPPRAMFRQVAGWCAALPAGRDDLLDAARVQDRPDVAARQAVRLAALL